MSSGPPIGSPLEEALKAITERAENYGDQAHNFEHIASLWRACFGWDVQAEDVALAMMLLKISRLKRTPGHTDSVTDIAGYAQCYWLTAFRADRLGLA